MGEFVVAELAHSRLLGLWGQGVNLRQEMGGDAFNHLATDGLFQY